MNTVKVRKQELMDILVKNRAEHEEEYRKACVVFWDDTRADIGSALDEINELLKTKAESIADLSALNRDVARVMIKMTEFSEPEQHLDDYDRAIAMLKMSVDTEIVLTADQFKNYVHDDWQWSRSFASNTRAYSRKFGG